MGLLVMLFSFIIIHIYYLECDTMGILMDSHIELGGQELNQHFREGGEKIWKKLGSLKTP